MSTDIDIVKEFFSILLLGGDRSKYYIKVVKNVCGTIRMK